MEVSHGRLKCRRCFGDPSAQLLRVGHWNIRNDPCYWGGNNPETLVLGFSKDFTQAKAVQSDQFEAIPFKGMRPRLTEVLRVLGVLRPSETVDQAISDPNGGIGFASLIRCSVSRLNEKKTMNSGTDVFECSGPLIKKSLPKYRRLSQIARSSFSPTYPLPLRPSSCWGKTVNT